MLRYMDTRCHLHIHATTIRLIYILYVCMYAYFVCIYSCVNMFSCIQSASHRSFASLSSCITAAAATTAVVILRPLFDKDIYYIAHTV